MIIVWGWTSIDLLSQSKENIREYFVNPTKEIFNDKLSNYHKKKENQNKCTRGRK
jgi:hypothetical protein